MECRYRCNSRGRIMDKLYKALDKLVEKDIILDYELSDDFGNGWVDMYLKIEE